MKYKGCICRSYLLQNAKTEVEVELFPCGRSMSFSTLNPLYTASMKRKKEPIWKRPNAGISTIPALGLFAFSDSPILDENFYSLQGACSSSRPHSILAAKCFFVGQFEASSNPGRWDIGVCRCCHIKLAAFDITDFTVKADNSAPHAFDFSTNGKLSPHVYSL